MTDATLGWTIWDARRRLCGEKRMDAQTADINAPDDTQYRRRQNVYVTLPKLTFIVTNHNYARYLRACIQSIVAQTYPDWECVVVDDASTDGSRELIAELQQELVQHPFRFIQQETNQGQLAAMTAGLAEAQGTFIAFVDSDDLLSPEFAARHMATHLLTAFPVGFTTCAAADISSDGTLIASNNVNMIPNAKLLDYPIDEFVRPVMRSNIEIPGLELFPENAFLIRDTNDIWLWAPTSGCVWRRDALMMTAPADARGLRIYGDFYFAIFINALSSSIFFDEVLVLYRRHGVNGFAGLPHLGGRAQIGIPRRDQMCLAKEIMLDHVFSRLSDFFDAVGAERFPQFLQCIAKSQEFRSERHRVIENLLLPRLVANYAEFERLLGPVAAIHLLAQWSGRRHAFKWARKIDSANPSRRGILRRTLRWRIRQAFSRRH